ncbi:hypothetical protein Tco_1163175 [Tanacetum coccineum]
MGIRHAKAPNPSRDTPCASLNVVFLFVLSHVIQDLEIPQASQELFDPIEAWSCPYLHNHSTCHKCVFNANHDACITKFLKEVNSCAKIFTGHRFSPNKTSVVYEKTYPRSDLRWKPTGRIFKTVGLRWIPTGKSFDSCTSKVDSEPPHGFNVDISKIYDCKQTLDLSAVVSKSSAVTTADASDKRQQQQDSTSSTSTLATTVTADGNSDL